MRLYLIVTLFLMAACSAKITEKKDNDKNLINENNMDKFIIKLKVYSDKSPYPDIKN